MAPVNAAYTDGETKYDSFAALYEDFANDCIEIVLGQDYSGKVTDKNIEAVLATCNYNEKPVVTHDAVWMYNPMNLFLDGTSRETVGRILCSREGKKVHIVEMRSELCPEVYGEKCKKELRKVLNCTILFTNHAQWAGDTT